jgi:hypothetical protein
MHRDFQRLSALPELAKPWWLEKVLAEEHERDKKHPDQIELPD